MSVKLQTEWYRKWRSTLLPNGKGMTMGAMYWQLNDVWDAPSWSSIGNYYVKCIFFLNKNIFVCNDL